MFDALGGCGWHTDSVFVFVIFSDQFSCIKFFDPIYGLKDIDFISLINFKTLKNPF